MSDPSGSSWAIALERVEEMGGFGQEPDPWFLLTQQAATEIQQDESLFWEGPQYQYAWFESIGLFPYLEDLQQRGYVDESFTPTGEAGVALIQAELRRRGIAMPGGRPSGGRRGGGGGGVSTAQRIENMMADMRIMALAWNVQIPDGNLRSLATTAVQNNFNNQRVLNSIGQYIVSTEGATDKTLQSQLGQWYKRQAADYGLRMSDQGVKQDLSLWVQGKETQESLQTKLLQRSKALYPHLKERFEAGETFESIASPYREYAASLLETAPTELDFVNSEMSKALSYNPDGSGNRLMSLSEFGQFVRSGSFGYEYTNKALTDASRVGEALSRMFGKV